MVDALQWLSANPMAFFFLGLVIVLLLAVCMLGFVQGREITFWPPKISAKPEGTKRIVQTSSP